MGGKRLLEPSQLASEPNLSLAGSQDRVPYTSYSLEWLNETSRHYWNGKDSRPMGLPYDGRNASNAFSKVQGNTF